MQIKKFSIILSFSFLHANFISIYDLANNNYLIKSLNYDIKIKKLNIKQAKNNYFPTLNVSLSYQKDLDEYLTDTNKTSSLYISNQFSVTLTQKLYDASIKPLIKDAKLNFELAKIQKNYNFQKLLYQLYSTYIDIIYNQQLIKLLKEKENNLKEIINFLEEKYKYKFSTPLDILNAQKKLIDIQNQYLQTSFKIKDSIDLLNILLNKKNIKINEQFKTDISDIHLPNYSFYTNPLLKTNELNTKITKNKIYIKSAKLYPTLNLQGNFYHTDYHKYIEREYSIKISLNIPIFNKSLITDKESAIINYQKDYYSFLNQKNKLKTSYNKAKNKFLYFKEKINNDLLNIEISKELKTKIEISLKNNLIDKIKFLKSKNKIIDYKIELLKDKSQLIKTYLSFLYITGKLNKEEVRKMKELFLR